MTEEEEFKKANSELLKMLPKAQIERVLSSDRCDIEPEFLGFVQIYKRLSQVIPKHFTVIDFGCSYAPQSFFFTDHKRYIGVDVEDGERFYAQNTEHHVCTTSSFISKNLRDLHVESTFAICSYVPNWFGHSRDEVKKAFQNVFTFYPSRSDQNHFAP